MKVRQGFVSNSSSSSFILIFDKLPETKDQLYDLMFPNGKETINYWDTVVSTMDVVSSVFNNLQGQKQPTKKELAELLSSPQIENESSFFKEVVPEYDFQRRDNDYWKEIRTKQNEIGKRHANQLLQENKEKKIRIIEYEDHTEFDALMEHGDIFSYGNLKAIRIGNH